MTEPYTITHNAAGRWCILYFGQHIGLELSVPTAAQAQSTADRLNATLHAEFGRGYDSGQNDAARQRYM